jgi:hypothetical protein
MKRAALVTLLAALVLGGSLQAQRAAAPFHGNGARSPSGSGFAGRHSVPNRFLIGHSHFHRNGTGAFFDPYFFPYDEPYGYEQPATVVTNGPAPAAPVPPAPEPAPFVPKAQVIEIPVAANASAAKMVPPTIFVLANGERLETRRYVLTASNLSLSIDRQQRSVPLDLLDIDATITANHERGIDLRIPADRNEISLSF